MGVLDEMNALKIQKDVPGKVLVLLVLVVTGLELTQANRTVCDCKCDCQPTITVNLGACCDDDRDRRLASQDSWRCVGRNCYLLVNPKTNTKRWSWKAATQYCVERAFHPKPNMLWIETQNEFGYIQDMMRAAVGVPTPPEEFVIWIGGYLDVRNKYVWNETQALVGYLNWAPSATKHLRYMTLDATSDFMYKDRTDFDPFKEGLKVGWICKHVKT